ncbi:MBL fold metallo-hydrolase [Acinetobacter sp. MD2(2019)]|uniref:MBL fold metallo-hydrolase n=1 Tax=Acinetobacter sp. MD2(2019) TaxID=2605273 RepID=UPI002D1E8FBA|nr:MBL fold metallo-hydrolase [Acinetobacter sp. MD2(2019)]MEB3753087.1 MBL fold metallo-hydrolase [Acinetobacter sp. MD2(2019)]
MDQNKTTLHYELPTKNCWMHVLHQPKGSFVFSPQFSDGKFHNAASNKPQGFTWNLFKWMMARKSSTWQVDRQQEFERFQNFAHEIPQNRPNADLNDWRVWFVGHATTLIQIGPYNFLTDPVWAEYAGPKQGVGPRRACPAGIALEQLPHIHAVLLSHNHYDHMDITTLTWLHKKFAMPIYTGLGNKTYLPKTWNVVELDWWQAAHLHGFEIVYTPAQHGSGRGLRDQNMALWGSFCLKLGSQYGFFAGDTAYANHFKEIHARFGAPRFALLPIGAYEPRNLMQYVHMNPQEAFKAHMDLHAQRSIAIHYRTFQLTDESRDAPEQALEDSMKNSSKLMNPFYCIHEGRRLSV